MFFTIVYRRELETCNKLLAVVASCETVDQLDNAQRWAYRVLGREFFARRLNQKIFLECLDELGELVHRMAARILLASEFRRAKSV